MPRSAILLGLVGYGAVAAVVVGIAQLVHPGSGVALFRLWVPVAAVIWWPTWYLLISRHYGAERVATFEATGRKQEGKYLRRLFVYFVPVVALVFLIVGLVDTGPGWRAAHGHGIPGTFTVTSQDCNRGCMTYGDFTSTDGSDTRSGVQLVEGGSSPHRTDGTTVAALDTADRLGVYPVGTKDWESSAVVAALGGAYLLGWVIWLIGAYVRRFGDRGVINLP